MDIECHGKTSERGARTVQSECIGRDESLLDFFSLSPPEILAVFGLLILHRNVSLQGCRVCIGLFKVVADSSARARLWVSGGGSGGGFEDSAFSSLCVPCQ